MIKKASIPSKVLGVKLSEEEKEALLQGQDTKLIKGFKDSNGNTFDAVLSLSDENQLIFKPRTSKISTGNEGNLAAGVFDRSVEEMNLIEYALRYNFRPLLATERQLFSESASLGNQFELLVGGAGAIIIAIYKLKDDRYRFTELTSNGPKGGIIDFHLQYVGDSKDEFSRSIDEYLLELKNGASISSTTVELTGITELTSEQALSLLFNARILTDRNLFEPYGIKDSTIDHTFFRNRFYSRPAIRPSPAKDDLLFPLFKNEVINGFALIDYKDKPRLQSFGSGIWLSNIINKEKIKKLVITSTPVDALAYHQLKSKPSDLLTVYASLIESDDRAAQIEEIQLLIDTHRPEQIVLALERSRSGSMLSSNLFGHLSEPREPFRGREIRKVENSEIRFYLEPAKDRNFRFVSLSVHLNFADFDKGLFMNENLVKYFEQINRREIGDESKLLEEPFKIQLGSIGKHFSKAEITFPLQLNLLLTVEKIVQHLRPLLFLKTDYSSASSHLDDLLSQSNKGLSKELRKKTG